MSDLQKWQDKYAKLAGISAANYPAHYEIADAAALQALERGDATPDQQKRALRWIYEWAAFANQPSFIPGSDRETAFIEGRQYVAHQIMKLLRINTQALKET